MQTLDFDQGLILEDDRVQLRPLQTKDIDHLATFAIHEPGLWKYSLLPGDGMENMKMYLQAALADRDRKSAYPFIVFDKRREAYAGSTRFYDYNQTHNTTQLGYTWYGMAFQGTGLNKHCKYLMLTYAFEQMGLDRVEFRADNNNARSIAAMKSIGCTVEGVLRSNCTSPSGRRDSIVLSILKEEWFESVKKTLEHKMLKE